MKRFIKFILLISLLALGTFFIYNNLHPINQVETIEVNESKIDENGKYTTKDDVALYIFTYNKLPSNYVTKNEAKKLGWVASKGNLNEVCKGCSIGGDVFTNREKNLPTKKKRTYYECDIDYVSGTRNAKRIVYSNDGLIYYTDDHYNTFELLYGEP